MSIIETLQNSIKAIERNTLLAAKNVLTIDDVVVLTGISKSTIYRMTSQGKIPYYKPNGGYIFFDRSEIENWQRQNRHQAVSEIVSQAHQYCLTHKK